jgi:hypothetical protein
MSFPHDSKDPGDNWGEEMIWGPKSGKSAHHYSGTCWYFLSRNVNMKETLIVSESMLRYLS